VRLAPHPGPSLPRARRAGRRRASALLAVLLGLAALAACGRKSPCERLADRLCGDLGRAHRSCREARQERGAFTREDQQACEGWLEDYDEFLRLTRLADQLERGTPASGPAAAPSAPADAAVPTPVPGP
jgi:hypothetical protein